MERRYDASIAGIEPVYQPPDKSWALSRQAQWIAQSCRPGAVVFPMPPVAKNPTLKERIALRREIIQAVEGSSGVGELPQWLSIFREVEPLLGPPTVDMESDSPGGRSGSWIHEMLVRAVDRPTPHVLSLVSGLMAQWVSDAKEDPAASQRWSLLVPPLPVMETWRPELTERFDFQIIDAARLLLEQSMSISALEKNKAMSLPALRSMLDTASILDQAMCPDLHPPADRHFTHALAHLRLQVDALIPEMGLELEMPHPQHALASFRMSPLPTMAWKTGACSIIDCFEGSVVLRSHIVSTSGAFDKWKQALQRAIEAIPAEQASLAIKRIDALSGHTQMRNNPAFAAAMKQTVMLNITPPAAAGNAPKPAPRF